MNEMNFEENFENEIDQINLDDDMDMFFKEPVDAESTDEVIRFEEQEKVDDMEVDAGLLEEAEELQLEEQFQSPLDFPVDINIQLGTLIVDANKAMSMTEGDLIKLETHCPGEVSLVFQGREIGRGRLVDVEGQLAVQITQNWCRS